MCAAEGWGLPGGAWVSCRVFWVLFWRVFLACLCRFSLSLPSLNACSLLSQISIDLPAAGWRGFICMEVTSARANHSLPAAPESFKIAGPRKAAACGAGGGGSREPADGGRGQTRPGSGARGMLRHHLAWVETG